MNKEQSHPLVSIAVLNWNGLEDTKQCLKSLRSLNYPNCELIVVDNGSQDSSKKYLSEQKDILFIDLPENTGFTGGHLAAAKEARGEYLAIFNNDLVIDPEWINEAMKVFANHPKAALVGGKLYKWNKNNPLFNRNNEYYAYQEVNPSDGTTYTLLVGEEERPVDSISGASLMFKRKVLGQVGYFDDDFFAYYEETDLIARMIRAGFEAYYNPNAVAWHKIAASSEGGETSDFYLYMMHRNRYMYALKNFDDMEVAAFLRNYRSEVLKQFLIFLRRRNQESGMRIKAYWWNRRHKKRNLNKRKRVQALGPTYSKKLGSYKPTDVTIVIPCYNYGNYVAEAIDSALNQTLKPQRVLIIDDGSTDSSASVIDKYKNNPLVEIIHKKNQGIVPTKNLGIQNSGTYWTVFLDADDILDKDYVSKLVALANKNRYDVTYTDMEYFGAGKDIFRSRPFSIFPMLQRNFIHNSALIKTSRLKQVGGYKEEMKEGLEDWELYLSLYEIGCSFGYLPEHIFKYRQHSGALSRNINVQKNREAELYRLLISLHPRIFKYMNPSRRRVIRLLRFSWSFVRYPGLFVVIIKAIPKALISGARTILHDVRNYRSAREGPR